MSKTSTQPKVKQTAKLPAQQEVWVNWDAEYGQLCWEIFFNTKAGIRVLEMLETRHFRSPTAIPGHDIAYTWINEGRNDLIRSFSNAAALYLQQPDKTSSAKTINRTRGKT